MTYTTIHAGNGTADVGTLPIEAAAETADAKAEVDEEPVGCPAWAQASVHALVDILEDPAFPCFYGRKALKAGGLHLGFAETATDPGDVRHLYEVVRSYLRLLDRLSPAEADWQVLILLIKPEAVPKPIEHYHASAWRLLQALHDIDQSDWPAAIPTDPSDRLFSYCLAGEPLFVNVSAPAHRKRRSRNLGPGLTFVINPRKSFDRLPGRGPLGERARAIIRSRTEAYDGQAVPDGVGVYGDEGSREWLQYVLPETNAPRVGERCPLVIRPRGISREDDLAALADADTPYRSVKTPN